MFLLNTIPLHVLVLMISGRFSLRIYVAYSIVNFVSFYNPFPVLLYWYSFVYANQFCWLSAHPFKRTYGGNFTRTYISLGM